MNKPLPLTNDLSNAWEPVSIEGDIHDAIVDGKLPSELNGTYYRNGANPQYVFSENYHAFDGDGMIHAVTFQNGKVSYKNRWVKTEKFKIEQQAGRALFAGRRDYGKSDVSVQGKSQNTANTSVIWHADKLLALQESSLPIEINSHSLDTIGNFDFNGALKRLMTAHPSIDHNTGEMLFYSYMNPPIEDHIQLYTANKSGKITSSRKVDVPFLSLMHDFAITRDWIIVPVFPFTLNFKRVMHGKPPIAWEPKFGTHFGLVKRNDDNATPIWFEHEACYVFHFINAYQDKHRIILDAMAINHAPDTADPFKQDSNEQQIFPLEVTRWIFNTKKKSIQKIILNKTNGELPRIDDRFIGRKYQHAYVATMRSNNIQKNLFDSITHFDMQTLQQKVCHLANEDSCGEPIFVPKNLAAKEGDGFVLVYVFKAQQSRSDLLILDAQHIDETPLAIVKFPHRIPMGFHGF